MEVKMNQLNGNEEFTLGGKNSGITVNEFWSWAYSDLLNNTYRGVLAEFLVEKSPPPARKCELTGPHTT